MITSWMVRQCPSTVGEPRWQDFGHRRALPPPAAGPAVPFRSVEVEPESHVIKSRAHRWINNIFPHEHDRMAVQVHVPDDLKGNAGLYNSPDPLLRRYVHALLSAVAFLPQGRTAGDCSWFIANDRIRLEDELGNPVTDIYRTLRDVEVVVFYAGSAQGARKLGVAQARANNIREPEEAAPESDEPCAAREGESPCVSFCCDSSVSSFSPHPVSNSLSDVSTDSCREGRRIVTARKDAAKLPKCQ